MMLDGPHRVEAQGLHHPGEANLLTIDLAVGEFLSRILERRTKSHAHLGLPRTGRLASRTPVTPDLSVLYDMIDFRLAPAPLVERPRRIPLQLEVLDHPGRHGRVVFDRLAGRHPQVRQALRQLFERDLHLHARERRAEAEMPADAETEMA